MSDNISAHQENFMDDMKSYLIGIPIYEHPDGKGVVEYARDRLVCTNEDAGTETRILIGPAGLRTLARKLSILADLLEVEYKQ